MTTCLFPCSVELRLPFPGGTVGTVSSFTNRVVQTVTPQLAPSSRVRSFAVPAQVTTSPNQVLLRMDIPGYRTEGQSEV